MDFGLCSHAILKPRKEELLFPFPLQPPLFLFFFFKAFPYVCCPGIFAAAGREVALCGSPLLAGSHGAAASQAPAGPGAAVMGVPPCPSWAAKRAAPEARVWPALAPRQSVWPPFPSFPSSPSPFLPALPLL